MNFRDFEYLIAVADLKHFGKAADFCAVSQPSLSIQIKKLEKTLGVKLLERTSRSVILTDVGKIIVDEARQILQKANNIRNIAKLSQDPFSGELNLGVIPTLTAYLLPFLMPELAKTESFPKLSIYLAESNSAVLLNDLKLGKLDAALLSLPIADGDIIVEKLFNEELLLALPSHHALSKKTSIDANDFEKENILILEDEYFIKESNQVFSKNVPQHFRATNLEILRYMVALKMGITLMPSLACQKTKGVIYLPFTKNAPTRTIALIYRQTTVKKQLLLRLRDHIKRLVAHLPNLMVL